MANSAVEGPAASTTMRMRQIGLAATALSLVVADCLPLLRPELGAQPRHAAISWLAVAFSLLVPVSILERLRQLGAIARRDLLAGPAVILALLLFPAIASFGWGGIAFLAAASAIAMIENLHACFKRHGVTLLWLWAPVILLSGMVLARLPGPPPAELASDAWITLLDPTGHPGGVQVSLLVTLLPLLVGSLAIGGTLVGSTLREQSTTSLVSLVVALFLATTLPSLGFGPGGLSVVSELMAAVVAALGLAPLFVLAADTTAEPPAPAAVIWAFSLLLILILSLLNGSLGFAMAAVLLSWIGRHYGPRSRFFQGMAVAALFAWAVAEALSGGWRPLSLPSRTFWMWHEEGTGAIIGNHVIAVCTILLATLGLQRGAGDRRRLAIMTVLVAIVAIDAPVLLLGFTEAQSLHSITALGWLVMPFLLAEILALIPSDPIFSPFRFAPKLRRG